MNLEIKSKEQIDLMIRALKVQQTELLDKISILQKELNDLELLLSKLKSSSNDYIEKSSDTNFDVNWSWRKKAEFILSSTGKWMTTREIADEIIYKYQRNYNRSLMVKGLSVPLTTLKEVFEKRLNDRNEYEFKRII